MRNESDRLSPTMQQYYWQRVKELCHLRKKHTHLRGLYNKIHQRLEIDYTEDLPLTHVFNRASTNDVLAGEDYIGPKKKVPDIKRQYTHFVRVRFK